MKKEDIKSVICILNPDDKYYLQQYSNCTDSLPYCVTLKDVKELKNNGVEISEDLCKENIILTRLPNKSKYIFRKPEDENSMIESKIKTIGTILSYIGAKSCSVSFTSSDNLCNQNSVNVNTNGRKDALMYSANVEFQADIDCSKSFLKEKSLLKESSWPGNYTNEGYYKAKEIAIQAGLDEDDGIKDLLEQRNPDHPNPISSNHYRIELYSTMKKSLEIATNIQLGVSKSLKLPLGNNPSKTFLDLGIQVNVERNGYAENREIMELNVEFGSYCPKDKNQLTKNEAKQIDVDQVCLSKRKFVSTIIGFVLIVVGIIVALIICS